MEIDVLTRADLQTFRTQLLNDIKQLFSTEKNDAKMNRWLRSKEVRKLLNISAGTLQTLRVTQKIGFTKIGNLYYYKMDDIEILLKSGEKGKS